MRRLSWAPRLAAIAAGAAAAAAAAACASPGAPPGGPVDITPPQLIAVAPESGRVDVRPRSVIFRFDEVVSERPAGVQSLAALFLISPQDGTPAVDWNRSEIAVRPRRGWRPNTIYTVTMLPGIADLRGNISRVGATTVFSTGGPIPDARITGQAFDWVAGRPAPGALVQAITPDSVVYLTTADTLGEFTLAHLRPGPYTVQAIIDANRNRALDPGERFDTVSVTLVETLAVELLTYARDSVPPRLTQAAVQDSITLQLTFDLPLDPDQSFSPAQFTVTDAERRPVTVLSAAAVHPEPQGPVLPRPIPPRTVLLTVATTLEPGAEYRVIATDVRGLEGFAGTTAREVTVPERPVIDPGREGQQR